MNIPLVQAVLLFRDGVVYSAVGRPISKILFFVFWFVMRKLQGVSMSVGLF